MRKTRLYRDSRVYQEVKEVVKMENVDIKLRVLIFTETKYDDMSSVQWNLIVKQKALKMIIESLVFLFQEDIDFITKQYPALVKEKEDE